ncbi:hypothetical protein A3K72_02940 [Candidatus Woesearchaeota archaeon RBG_13_36_6]|nr:MAG: hypothetical protein A3K72_02940 [Candidatus Woesearchaeota archaeon RBG_13_36_6]
MLETSLYWEEEFLIKYDTENMWGLLKTLPEEKFEKIRELFQENLSDTQRHSKILKELMKRIGSDEYEL